MILLAGLLLAADVSVHGRVYSHYEQALSDSAGFSGFGISRAYLTVKATFPENQHGLTTSIRITQDVARLADLVRAPESSDVSVKNPYDAYLKYAYGKIASKTGFFAIMGQQPHPWVDYETGLWSFRFAQKVFTDRAHLLHSADLGVSLGYENPWVQTQAMLVNGQGYKSSEIDRVPTLGARVSLFPVALGASSLRELGLHAYYQADTGHTTMIGAVSWGLEKNTGLMAQFVSQDDVRGFEAWAWLDVGRIMQTQSFGAVARYEKLESSDYLMAGIFAKPAGGLSLSIDYQAENQGDESVVSLHTQVKF